MLKPSARMDDDDRHFLWKHICLEEEHEGRLPINSDMGWQLDSKDPITISPSIHCQTCGTHGWIRNGEWVDA